MNDDVAEIAHFTQRDLGMPLRDLTWDVPRRLPDHGDVPQQQREDTKDFMFLHDMIIVPETRGMGRALVQNGGDRSGGSLKSQPPWPPGVKPSISLAI